MQHVTQADIQSTYFQPSSADSSGSLRNTSCVETTAYLQELLHCIGPLASFACDEDGVEHPYVGGVALISDAVATTQFSPPQHFRVNIRSGVERAGSGSDTDT